MTRSKGQELRRQAMRPVEDQCPLKVATGQDASETFDPVLFDKLHYDWIIMDWGGNMQDALGNPLPCTMETKYQAMNEDEVFYRFVMAKAGLLASSAEELERNLSENLSNSSGSSETSQQDAPLARPDEPSTQASGHGPAKSARAEQEKSS